MIGVVKQEIEGFLHAAGIEGPVELSQPPKADMGDLAFGCFALAKERGDNPAAVAKEIAAAIEPAGFVQRVEAFGPYVNFFLDYTAFANALLGEIRHNAHYGAHTIGAGKQYLVEYACPNPLKAFHLGHLKNLITGEAVVRMFENAGYEVKRVNYQGDVGMHIAKSLWGIFDWMDQFEDIKDEPDVKKRVEFLGKAYAHGAQYYESSDAGKEEVEAYNAKVYTKDESIQDVYDTARAWSLEYFDLIYKKLGSHFDRLYFESEIAERATELIEKHLADGVFTKSDGAVIFKASELGLHDRVFLNSKGFPTYEGKDIALAELHFSEYTPDMVIHVVGKEQTEYFKVVFAALEHVFPETKGKEYHLPGGFLQLKGDQKMSSRTGNIITGDALLFSVEEKIRQIMDGSDLAEDEHTVPAITAAALKYAMLKVEATRDVAFDVNESVSTSGDSGPYLLYIVARIKSIIEKADTTAAGSVEAPLEMAKEEERLLYQLSLYPEVTERAVESLDPSRIAKYLYELAQAFNSFYSACPILQSEDLIKQYRIALLHAVEQVMTHGLSLIGIETVERM